MSDDKNTVVDNNDESGILQTAVTYMDTFLTEVNNITSEFRSGKYMRLNELSNLFEGFQWIYAAVKKLNKEYGAEIAVDKQRFEETLKTAEEALQNSDIVLLTDILEYEVIEMVREWFGSN